MPPPKVVNSIFLAPRISPMSDPGFDQNAAPCLYPSFNPLCVEGE